MTYIFLSDLFWTLFINPTRFLLMEINLSSLLSTDMFQFSHSVAEGGSNAGRETWQAALAGPRPLLDVEGVAAFRSWVKDFGAWDAAEIAGWSVNECEALFLQFVAGDVREAGFDSLESMTPEDWAEYEAESTAGKVSGNLFRSDSGEVFFSLCR